MPAAVWTVDTHAEWWKPMGTTATEYTNAAKGGA